MFRPYNLTSLAAWTAGSLAGNEAYYRTKGNSRRFTQKIVSYPPNVLRVSKKLEIICKEINRLIDCLRSDVGVYEHKIDIAPLVRITAYNEWFQSRKESFKAELQGCEVKNLEVALDSVADQLNQIISDGEKALFSHAPNVEVQRKILQLIKERQVSCKVDEHSFKLVDSNAGRFFLQ